MSGLEQKIIDILHVSNGAFTNREIADETLRSIGTIRSATEHLWQRGLVTRERIDDGQNLAYRYRLRD